MEERGEEGGDAAERPAGGLGGLGVERLLEEQGPKLTAILAKFRIPPADADDLLQNVLVQLVRKRDRIREPAPWLRGALRNECRMYWRSRSRSFTTAVDTSILELVSEGVAPKQERRVLRDNLARWIGDLDARCRSILRLRYHLGYEPREVAEELGYRPSSIDKVTRRCLDALGRKVAAAQPAPDAKTKSRPGSAAGGSWISPRVNATEPGSKREPKDAPGGGDEAERADDGDGRTEEP